MGNVKKTVLTGKMLLCALLWWPYNKASGQDQAQYIKTMNSIVPGTPEASSIMKYIDFPVSLFTGQPNINIPICEVKGKSLSVPVSLSYTATSGIKLTEIAGKVGLGWALFAGGEITREVRGGPDNGGNGVAGLLNNTHSYSDYAIDIFNYPNGTYGTQAARGELDLEPDLFYFSMAGHSGKFIYDEETGSFVCTQLEPYKVKYTKSSSYWEIVAPDGNIYLFDKRVQSATQQYCNFTAPVSNPPLITTSWKLTKITNADKTDSVVIEYDNDTYSYYTEGSSIKYQHLPQQATTARPPMDCFNKNTITGKDKIRKICSAMDTVTFQYYATVREDMDQQSAIEKIIYSNGAPESKMIFKLHHDYYLRPIVVGDYNAQQDSRNRKSLRLKQLTNYGNSESNANPLKWIFTYNSTTLPARLSYAQDFWGYYNNNEVTNTLVPKDVLTFNNTGNFYVDGADRIPDPEKMKAGVLEKIQFPTGGTTTFEYEPNEVGYKVQLAYANTELVSIDTLVGMPYGQWIPSGETYEKTFTINEDPDPATNYNNPNGGAYVNIFIDPVQSPAASDGTYYPNDIHFDISGTVITHNLSNYYLPNGTYTIKVNNAWRANHSPYYAWGPGSTQPYEGQPGPSLFYAIQYKHLIKNPHGIVNRQLGGLRIKSITSTDYLTGSPVIKRYGYRDPVKDSSYGYFTGSVYRGDHDYLVKNNGFTSMPNAYTCDVFPFFARNGNCIMPGSNSLGAAVVYPIVYEYTVEANKSYKTEYRYHYVTPDYSLAFPYAPATLNEASHGKLLQSTAFKTLGNNTYHNARSVKNQYDFSPVSHFNNPGTGFGKFIKGLKVAFKGYSDDPLACAVEIAPKEYYTWVNFATLTSDTTITYDLNNPYKSVKEWRDYVYGDYNQQPVIVRSGNSDGSVSVQKTWYAADAPQANSHINAPLSELVSANRVSMPLGTVQYKDGQVLSEQYTGAHFDGSKLLVDNIRQSLSGNPPETEAEILLYDSRANPLTIRMRGNKYRKYIWQTAKSLPLATCVMPANSRFYFSSFEYASDGPGRVAGNAFSGSYAYQLSGSNSISIPAAGTPAATDVYVWATGSNFQVNNATPQSTGKTKGNWTLYKRSLSSTGAITITGGALIDQVVVLPRGSQFQGNVYDASNRIIAIVNDQVMTSFFEYDAFGRLIRAKDEQGNIIKSSAYQYQGPQ